MKNVGNANNSGITRGSDSYLGETWVKPGKSLAGLGSTEEHVLRTAWVERHVGTDLGPSTPPGRVTDVGPAPPTTRFEGASCHQ